MDRSHLSLKSHSFLSINIGLKAKLNKAFCGIHHSTSHGV